MALHQNCLNGSTPMNKMAPRAKNRKPLQTTSPPKPMPWFQSDFPEMFLSYFSTKFLNWLCFWTKRPPELKIEMFIVINSFFKWHFLINHPTSFIIISCKWFCYRPVQKLLKWFCYLLPFFTMAFVQVLRPLMIGWKEQNCSNFNNRRQLS